MSATSCDLLSQTRKSNSRCILFTTGVIVALGGAVPLVLVKTDNNIID